MDLIVKDKIAIIGYAPSNIYADALDSSWEKWGLNHKFDCINKCDKWFDLHFLIKDIDINYYNFLQKCENNFITCEGNLQKFTKASVFPEKEIKEYFQTNYFTNTISWLIALAIYKGAKEIGLYGINLACRSEYEYQRPSVFYFLKEAIERDIKITIPSSSKLLNGVNLNTINKKELIKQDFIYYWDLLI